MLIREAINDDVDAIIDMAEKFWQHTQFKNEVFCRDTVMSKVYQCMDDDLCLVAQKNGFIIGFVCGVRGSILANDSVSAGTELAWWVEPEYRGSSAGVDLLTAIENKAKDTGIKYWNMAYMESSMPDKVKCIYQKMGYSLQESLYTKVL